jgi:hypothetical protein
MSTFLKNINSQQTVELISEVVRNKKHVLKRILEQENDEFTSKRLRNNEDEDEDVTLSNFDFNLNSSGVFSSTQTQMQSNSNTGRLYIFQL